MTDGKNDLKKALTGVFQKLESLSASEWAHQYEDALGHTANSRIPAYELEYGEEHSHRQPDELADITAFYNAFGLQMMTQAHERPDHISVECEFMSYLLYKEAFALGEEEGEKREIAREAARKFLRDHLGRWLPAFAARLSKSVHPLMRAVGDLALEFILQDCALSGLEPGSLYLPLRLVQEGEETGCVSCKKC